MNIKIMIQYVFAPLVLVLLLTSCGGGGSEEKNDNSNHDDTLSPVISIPEVEVVVVSSKLKKTGQNIISYDSFDDGYYDLGITPSYSRDDDMVVDNVTGLMWRDGVDLQDRRFEWEDAMYYCSGLSHQGYSDWRLPSIKEFMGLIDRSNENQAFDPIFSDLSSYILWSSTVVLEEDSLRWGMNARNVGGYRYERHYEHAAMCVRG